MGTVLARAGDEAPPGPEASRLDCLVITWNKSKCEIFYVYPNFFVMAHFKPSYLKFSGDDQAGLLGHNLEQI